jgi:cytochrome c
VQPSIANDTEQTSKNSSKIKQSLTTANAAQGKRLYLQCRACHSLEAGGINTVGPNLHGLFGSAAGQAEGFNYSDVLLESGVVWTPKTLDKWLARPSDFLPGNRMIFAGVSDPADRADLILYLLQATGTAD